MPLSIDNLLVSIGVAYDLQLKAADNLFYAAAVQVDDPSKPMFGGSGGTAAGGAAALFPGVPPLPPPETADGYFSINNGVEGDPIAVKQISTPNGPLYKVVDGSGNEIMCEAAATTGGSYKGVPRYQVKSDGLIYDILNLVGGFYQFPTTVPPAATFYDLPVGRITFKAKEGASLTRATDEQQRAGQVVQLLTRLLEGLQEESKSFAQIIR